MSDNDDIYTVRRKRKRADAQARSTAKRKGKGAPGRDDLGRAAYYTLLALYNDPNFPKHQKAGLQRQIMAFMEKAGFDLIEANSAFLKDARGVLDSVNGWLCRRHMEQGKHLGPEGKPYRRLTGLGKRSDQLITRSNGGSSQGNGQPMIENGVTCRPTTALAEAT
jgi:hypothetical protein